MQKATTRRLGEHSAFKAGVGFVILLLMAAVGSLAPGCSDEDGSVGDETGATVKTDTGSAAALIEEKIIVETVTIPFESVYEDDANMALGEAEERQGGVDGSREVTYKVTYKDGIEIGREMISETVVTEPVTHMVAVGTKVAPRTDTATTGTTSTTGTTPTTGAPGSQQPQAGSCPSGAVAVCADGSITYGSSNRSVPLCAGRGGVARTC